MLKGSPGKGLNTVNVYPSYLFKPSSVPIHIMPLESWKIQFGELWDRPSLIDRLENLILPFSVCPETNSKTNNTEIMRLDRDLNFIGRSGFKFSHGINLKEKDKSAITLIDKHKNQSFCPDNFNIFDIPFEHYEWYSLRTNQFRGSSSLWIIISYLLFEIMRIC